jgi:Flp pilus assembly pilin Flp
MINTVRRKLSALFGDKKGLETLEYAVFAVAFLVVIVSVTTALSSNLSSAYSSIGNWIKTQAGNM